MAEGGYDYSFVDKHLPDEFICALCTLVARDPHQTDCCHNIFCDTCLKKLRRSTRPSKPNCPLCSQKKFASFKDGIVNRKIIGLEVYCSNREEGCDWQGTINETGTSIGIHLNNCPYQLVPCTDECGEEIRRSALETHLADDCTKRLVNCKYCNRIGRYQLITSSNHLDECPDLPVQCNNEGCNEKILRRSLASHNETCPKATVPCEYNTLGCNKKIKRQEQERHNEMSILTHQHLTKNQLEERIKSFGRNSEVFKVSQFGNIETWQSPGFYTSPLFKYKMSLLVFPNGKGAGKGTHVSCFLCLVAGEYDDILEWPFQGEGTVELLNRLEDKNHKKCTISFDDTLPEKYRQRAKKGTSTNGYGIDTFVSHKELKYNAIANLSSSWINYPTYSSFISIVKESYMQWSP
ncbi:PREDICTED: TNF receptor-associated factor 3-like [Amphimedon queenslandica]|uniref:RING-type E3 ubiquitin transferase n=1 Tax=Amphimedon queenslandica TaxID=400682 RepID=A0A1X7TM95_AMPQE|nr:PREDICTED: TNF receptor-associated factor 3-like [Amphimedon queenslandica]|eukprot:XP_019858784.1 PREDICTED: TNF receptor-associated factor 3-like [Amphimedon queenslandica]